MLKRLVFFLLCLPFFAWGEGLVLGDRTLLPPKTLEVTETIGTELYSKTQISLYTLLDDTKHTRVERQALLAQITATLKSPYFLIYFFKADKKIDFLTSQDMQNLVNLNRIYENYMVPLLPIKASEELDSARVGAIVLNGYAHLADTIAESKKVHLASNIVDKSGELLASIARIAIKIMLAVLVCFVVWFYLIRRGR